MEETSFMPKNTEEYGKQTYWNDRFSKETEYEWLKGYAEFASFVNKRVKKDARILIIGSGNSNLGADMTRDGFENIICMDYSSVVIETMKNKHAYLKQVKYIQSDLRSMKEFEDEEFDFVLGKAVLDTFSAGEKDAWSPSDEYLSTMETVLSEISRILKLSGKYLEISFAQRHFRLPILEKDSYNWQVDVELYGETFHYFLYWITKGKL